MVLAQRRAAAEFHRRYDVLATPVCPRITPKTGELAPPQEQLRMSNLLLGKMDLGWLMAHNPLVEQQSLKALQYVGFTAPFQYERPAGHERAALLA